jgi:putative hydrolase of the HAD superfamily
MGALLEGAGVAADRRPDLVNWLWSEQPHRNLFRRPIGPMIALARELQARGVKLAVLSNSEGRLAELLTEIEVAGPFAAIIDSGRLPWGKPDPRIFHHTLEVLGVTDADVVHIGDSWTADVEPALAVGWRAIWYRSRGAAEQSDARVPVARDASEVRAALVRYGFLR